MPRALLTAAGAARLAAAPAAAAGGKSLATAPLLHPGVQVSGDTYRDETGDGTIGSEVSPGCWNDVEYWRLVLGKGDRVSITGKAMSPANHFGIGIFPAGTTDRNLSRAVAVTSTFPRRGPIAYTARAAGTYVLVIGPTCYNATDGPYELTATIRR